MAGTIRPHAMKRRAFLASVAAGVTLLRMLPAVAQTVRFFKIGAGPTGGTLFRSAGWVSAAISNPPGSRPCERNGSCGVPGLIALAQSTDGGEANLKSLRDGTLDAGIAYADMAHDALAGRGGFTAVGPFRGLRALAALGPESLHVLVRRGAGIKSIGDLAGKRIAIGAEISGPADLAVLILRLYGVRRGRYRAVFLNPEAAAGAFAAGDVDAMFLLARAPSAVVRQMVEDHGALLLPISPRHVAAAIKANPFLFENDIPTAAYGAAAVVPTVATVPVLLVRDSLDAVLVTELSRALWLAMADDAAHPLDAAAFASAQIHRRGVPLHPAAQAFRDEMLRKSEVPRG
ncbi:MAG: TAXI family TRAP transporter solute-binding subunit [Rhodospirillaceae bacterium]|nr:TAXI family TRAP transporter solute-binding subunit [Rhodospirillaceae bacterium]